MAQVKALIGNIKGKDGIANVYSPSEIEIGTWNGHTLYRKIYSVKIPSTSTEGTFAYEKVNTGILYPLVISAYLMNISSSSTMMSFSTVGCTDFNSPVPYAQENYVWVRNGYPAFNGMSAYLVVEYIK